MLEEVWPCRGVECFILELDGVVRNIFIKHWRNGLIIPVKQNIYHNLHNAYSTATIGYENPCLVFFHGRSSSNRNIEETQEGGSEERWKRREREREKRDILLLPSSLELRAFVGKWITQGWNGFKWWISCRNTWLSYIKMNQFVAGDIDLCFWEKTHQKSVLF